MPIVRYETVPIADLDRVIDKSSAKSCQCIPTLQQLACESIMSNFKEKSTRTEQNVKAAQHVLAKTADQSRLTIYEQHRKELQTSSEANFYSLAVALVPKAKEVLRVRAQQLLDSAKKEASNIISLADRDRSLLRRECCQDHLSTFKEQRSFSDSCAGVANRSGGEQETLFLCFTPEYRKVFDCFDYRSVPQHKRCTEPKCTTDFPNCGCSVTACGVCHQMLCSLHLRSNPRDCIQTTPRRCGYREGRIYPEFCTQVLEGDNVQKPCFHCNVNVAGLAATVVVAVIEFGAIIAAKIGTYKCPPIRGVVSVRHLEMPPWGGYEYELRMSKFVHYQC
jgi:hypothetical protein